MLFTSLWNHFPLKSELRPNDAKLRTSEKDFTNDEIPSRAPKAPKRSALSEGKTDAVGLNFDGMTNATIVESIILKITDQKMNRRHIERISRAYEVASLRYLQ